MKKYLPKVDESWGMNYYLKDATESISQWLLNDSGEMEHSKIKKALDFDLKKLKMWVVPSHL